MRRREMRKQRCYKLTGFKSLVFNFSAIKKWVSLKFWKHINLIKKKSDKKVAKYDVV